MEEFDIGLYVPGVYIQAEEDLQDLLDCFEYAAPKEDI